MKLRAVVTRYVAFRKSLGERFHTNEKVLKSFCRALGNRIEMPQVRADQVGIPVVAGPCPHPNACLNCAHFRTDISFLEVHKAELRETERVIAKANENGWVRQIEMNERKRKNLCNIITSLEQIHA
jgi:hypothetical protein